jgi:Mce-associated membrane protein
VSEEEPQGAAEAAESDRIARLRARAETGPVPPAAPAPPAPVAPAAPPPAAPPPAASPAPGPVSPAPAQGFAAAEPVSSTRLAVAVVTAVLAATATALAGLVTVHVSSVDAVEHTRTDVIGAATSGVARVLSYDYRHLDGDFTAAERLLTPHFRKQYDDTTAKGVRPLAAKYKAISSADVSAAGIVDAGRDRAVVLVFVNQTVTNSQLTAPRLDRSRIDVTMVRSDGRWLIDRLTTL